MSATVAAALKKIAVYILTEKKALKVVGGIVLGIIIIIIMPIVAIIGIFTGSVEIDTDHLHEMIQENQSAVMETWNTIETSMTDAGYSTLRIKEAKVLFVYALYDKTGEDNFADRLVGCFNAEQTDEELINAVNSEFDTEISVKEFTDMMSSIRTSHIDWSDYTDPTTKNNLDLAKWAIHAYERGWGYVWGTYGDVLNKDLFEYKKTQFPEEVGGKAKFIEENWLGGRTADCIGLIKGYSWFDTATEKIIFNTNGMPDLGADSMYENATEKGTIDTIPEIPGLAVWHEGHIGIYIGNGKVVHAANTNAGVIQTPIDASGWTHWMKIPYISYIEESEEST